MERGRTSKRIAGERAGSSKINNNFTILRIIAAVFVFVGHMGVIHGGQPPTYAGFSVHELGVKVLFLLSGYLIMKSWMSDPHPFRYTMRRFFRFWPPYAVMILLMTFVTGPLVSELGWKGYFDSWYTVYLKNLRLFIVYAQPGVFTDLPIPNVSNGSLWTMPVEAVLYVLLPFLVLLLRNKKTEKISIRKMAAFTVGACLLDLILWIFFEQKQLVFYGTDLFAAWHLVVMFIIGMLYSCEEVQRYLHLQTGVLALLALPLVQFSHAALRNMMLYLILPYFIFSFGLSRRPLYRNVGKRVEISYGIYLYGFFFQQLVMRYQVSTGRQWSFLVTLLFSMALTIPAALLSYYIVEKPAIAVGRFLIKRQTIWSKRREDAKKS